MALFGLQDVLAFQGFFPRQVGGMLGEVELALAQFPGGCRKFCV